MAASDSAQPAQGTLVAQEKSKLRKVLRRFDLVLFTACTIIGLDSAAAASQAGAHLSPGWPSRWCSSWLCVPRISSMALASRVALPAVWP